MFLYKRRGVYYFSFFDETENRNRRISTHARRKEEALKFLSNFKGRQTESSRPRFISLSKFSETYCQYVKNRYTLNYFPTVERSLDALKKYAGDVPLKEVDRRLLETFFDSVSAKSKNTANLYHRTLAAAFSKAVEWNNLTDNVLKKIKLSKIPKKLPVFITKDELTKLIEHTAKEDMRDFFLLGFHTGLRLSELLNLDWQAVDLVEATIKVSNTDTFTTKSKRERFIPLNQTALDTLRRRELRVRRQPARGYVFFKHPGLRYERDYVSKQFKKAVRAAKLNERLHFHSLRHSTASNMVRRGVPIAVVKEVLGHTDIKTTMVYSHVKQDDLVKAVKTLEAPK